MRFLSLLVCAALGAERLPAQLDLLTLREALSLVERVPEVSEAQKKRECPSASGGSTLAGPDDAGIQVRRECGPNGGQLINNYLVNRRTGAVTVGLEKIRRHRRPWTRRARIMRISS